MIAAMAVELFINLYAYAFMISAIIAIALLVSAARRLERKDKEQEQRLEKQEEANRLE